MDIKVRSRIFNCLLYLSENKLTQKSDRDREREREFVWTTAKYCIGQDNYCHMNSFQQFLTLNRDYHPCLFTFIHAVHLPYMPITISYVYTTHTISFLSYESSEHRKYSLVTSTWHTNITMLLWNIEQHRHTKQYRVTVKPLSLPLATF